jgi:hypothetical protein
MALYGTVPPIYDPGIPSERGRDIYIYISYISYIKKQGKIRV